MVVHDVTVVNSDEVKVSHDVLELVVHDIVWVVTGS